VQAVLDEEKIEDRRYLLEQMARNIPQWLDKIKRRVAERFENRRKAA
jgi:phage shock protein A